MDLHRRRGILLDTYAMAALGEKKIKSTDFKNLKGHDSLIIALIFTLAFTATEDGAGQALEWEKVIQRLASVTFKIFGQERLNAYSGLGIIRQAVYDETLRANTRSLHVPVADVAAGAGNQSITMKIPYFLTRNYWQGKRKGLLDGAVPVRWITKSQHDFELSYTLGGATICGTAPNTWTMTVPTMKVEALYLDSADSPILPFVKEEESDVMDGNNWIEVPGTGDGYRRYTGLSLEDVDGLSAFVHPTGMQITKDNEPISDTVVNGNNLYDEANDMRDEKIDNLMPLCTPIVTSPRQYDSQQIAVADKLELYQAGKQHSAAGDDHTGLRTRWQYNFDEATALDELQLRGLTKAAAQAAINERYHRQVQELNKTVVFMGGVQAAAKLKNSTPNDRAGLGLGTIKRG